MFDPYSTALIRLDRYLSLSMALVLWYGLIQNISERFKKLGSIYDVKTNTENQSYNFVTIIKISLKCSSSLRKAFPGYLHL